MAVLLVPSAAAASPSARLVYGRGADAEQCPDEGALRRAVAARVGYDPFFPHAPRTVVLTIVRRDGDLVARLELVEDQRASASRELVSSDAGCDELFQSAALAIAIAIDPRVLVAPSGPPPSAPGGQGRDEVTTPAPIAAPPEESERPSPAVERPVRAERPPAGDLRLMLSTRAMAGLQPNVAPGAFAGAAIVWRGASLGGEVGAYLPGLATGASGAQARVWFAGGALVPCLRFAPVNLCGVLSAGRFEASGERVRGSTSDASLFLGLGGRSGVELPLWDRVRAHVDGELLGNLARATVKVGSETIWKSPPLVFSLSAAVSFTFDEGPASPHVGSNRGSREL